MSDDNDDLEKVYIDLPNHWATGGESIWAKRLDKDLYELDNVPFYAYGLNYGDIVRTDSIDINNKPVVLEVIKPSGHQTFRIIFPSIVNRELQDAIIADLEKIGVECERAFENYVALDLNPKLDYDDVRNRLDKLQDEELLEYETCDQRVPDSFDDVEDEESEDFEEDDAS